MASISRQVQAKLATIVDAFITHLDTTVAVFVSVRLRDYGSEIEAQTAAADLEADGCDMLAGVLQHRVWIAGAIIDYGDS